MQQQTPQTMTAHDKCVTCQTYSHTRHTMCNEIPILQERCSGLGGDIPQDPEPGSGRTSVDLGSLNLHTIFHYVPG